MKYTKVIEYIEANKEEFYANLLKEQKEKLEKVDENETKDE